MSFKFSKKVNYKLFTETPTKESSYILGLLWADGSIVKKTNSINLECVIDDINEFYPIFETVGQFNLYSRSRENRKTQGNINCSSFELSNFLKENDYLSKSKTSPKKILEQIPEELHRYFFLGWSDGDGCFYYSKDFKTKQFVMSGSFEQDWTSLEEICKKLKIYYIINKFETKKGHKYSRFLIARNEGIMSFANFIYVDNGDFGLKRKYEKYKVIKDYINSKKTYTYYCYKNDEIIKSFNTLKSASDWLNKGRYVGAVISDSISGRTKTAHGYIWKKIKNQ